jgi:hypothetical protein
MKYLTKSGIENFVDNEHGDDMTNQVVGAFVDNLRDRIEKVKLQDFEVKEYVKEEKKKRKARSVDSDLGEFLK